MDDPRIKRTELTGHDEQPEYVSGVVTVPVEVRIEIPEGEFTTEAQAIKWAKDRVRDRLNMLDYEFIDDDGHAVFFEED